MKTRIIQLEAHDDLISIRDRMAWAKSPRMLLVWPRRGQVDLRPLDLKLLQRHAFSLGSQIGLVTRSRRIRDEAQALGIPVFDTMPEAQRGDWHGAMRKRPLRRHAEHFKPGELRTQLASFRQFAELNPTLRLVVFSLGVLAVLAVVILFIPSAQITLKPVTEVQQVTIPVSTSPDVETLNMSGSVPMHTLTMALTAEGSMPVTSRIPVPDRKATGRVLVTNLTANVLVIPSGTVLQTIEMPYLQFVTLEVGRVSPAPGSTSSLPIEAMLPGSSGNLKANTEFIMEGALGLSIKVTNPASLSGGTDRFVTGPTESDRETLRKTVLADLSLQAKNQLQTSLDLQDLLIEETVTAGDILDEYFDPVDGQAGEILHLNLTVEYSVVYLAGSDLQQLVVTTLDASLPENYVPVDGSLYFAGLGPASLDSANIYRWRIQAKRLARPEFDPLGLLRLVQGRSLKKASQQLEKTLALASKPEIMMEPSWWPILPLIPFRIVINY